MCIRDSADTVAKYIVRSDGSTFHQYNFNPSTGAPKGGVTGQGYDDSSCWSRGQAWAVYGFTEAYEYTGISSYLDIAEKAARYFVAHLMPYGLPLWDFDCASLPFRPVDASAAAIALSGLITLNKHRRCIEFENGIRSILNGLITHCSALEIEGWESVLLHACIGSAYRKGSEHTLVVPYTDCPLIYADYYFLEALMKLEGLFNL